MQAMTARLKLHGMSGTPTYNTWEGMIGRCKDVKDDYLAVLAVAQHEVPELYKSLLSGRVDGSTYTGECACLVGTIAHARHEDYEKLGIDLRPDSNRPAEKWFLNIRKGDTPENNQVSAIVKEWTEEFAEEKGIKLPVMEVVWKEPS